MITEGRRVIKIAVIIPFPIYRPNKIMRIDAVSVEYRRTAYLHFIKSDGGRRWWA